MSGTKSETTGTPEISQADFERVTPIINGRFRVDEALLEHGLPTYYLQRQETKQAFLKVLEQLETMNFTAILRRIDGRIVLRVVPKPSIKPSNVVINWILLIATVATTFVTGYMLSSGLVEKGIMPNPLIGGAAFAAAIMAVLGTHEMGHKLTANKNGMEATLPYFIPGLPPNVGGFGTFGAVIMQKELAPNRDALFDVGSAGPIAGFVLAVIVSLVGLAISPMYPLTGKETGFLPTPLVFELFIRYLVNLPPNHYILVHPVAFAGWVGMVVTMLNLLPAGMLDGGHVARSMAGERLRPALTVLSILYLIIEGFWPMAILVLFVSSYRHPGPLDDVSGLSASRKLIAVALVAIFVLCTFPYLPSFGF